MKKNKKGFTLIELLSTLVILGIIATIAIQTYNILIVKNDDSKYTYYRDFIEKGADLYFDAKKINMVSGECLSVNYQTLVDKNYIKEEGVTCTGNIILRKDGKKYIYDDSNLECKSNGKVVKKKGDTEAICNANQIFTFDENYERLKNIAPQMAHNEDKWKDISTYHNIEVGYDLGSAKQFYFINCASECGIYQDLSKQLITDKTYRWSANIKAKSGKRLKVGVGGTTGMVEITSTGNWQNLSGEFAATSTDESRFNIISEDGWSDANDDLYVNSIMVYEVSPSLKNKMAFTVNEKFGDGLPTPERDGWNFVGWFTEPIGGSQITKDTIVPNTKNTTYYAHWTEKITTVTYYETKDKTNKMASDTVTYGNDYTMQPSTFTKTGYTFNYWQDLDNNKSFNLWPSTPITWNYTQNINLFVVWKANTYTIAYDGNGATGGSTASSSHQYNTSKQLNANGFTKTGYSFDGWNTKSDGTGTSFTDTQSVKNLTTTAGATITLYAKWKPNNYIVTLSKGTGITGVSGAGSYTVGSEVTINATAKLGYRFNDWKGTLNSTTQKYTFTMPPHDVTITAVGYRNPVAYLYSDGTLEFCPYEMQRSDKTLVKKFTDWDTKTYDRGKAPWYKDYRSSIKSVIIKKGALPSSTANWFGGYHPDNGSDWAQKSFSYLHTIKIENNGLTSIDAGFAYYATKLENLTIPNSVTRIDAFAFEGTKKLTSVNLPDNLKYIGEMAFKTSGLTTIEIPDSCTTIESDAFYNCYSLTTARLPRNLEAITYYVFRNCTSLRTVYIPVTVVKIRKGAFYNCPKLSTIHYQGNSTQWKKVRKDEDNSYLTRLTPKYNSY